MKTLTLTTALLTLAVTTNLLGDVVDSTRNVDGTVQLTRVVPNEVTDNQVFNFAGTNTELAVTENPTPTTDETTVTERLERNSIRTETNALWVRSPRRERREVTFANAVPLVNRDVEQTVKSNRARVQLRVLALSQTRHNRVPGATTVAA